MLIVANNLRELTFGKLMEVYAEGNLENGHDLWPDEPEGRQIALAEQEFYHYLREVFFKTPRACYFIWEGSRVSMRVARGSASLLPSHGRGIWPLDVLKTVSRAFFGLRQETLASLDLCR